MSATTLRNGKTLPSNTSGSAGNQQSGPTRNDGGGLATASAEAELNPNTNFNPDSGSNLNSNSAVDKYRQLTLKTANLSINNRKPLKNNLTTAERTTLNKLN